METFKLIIQLLPFVVKLMEAAEQVFGDGTGEQKKQAVMAGTEAVMSGIVGTSTGGQKNWWQKFSGNVGGMIDNLASILFPKDKG